MKKLVIVLLLCTFVVIVGCGGGGGGNTGSNPPPSPPPQSSQLAITSSQTVVPINGTFQFTATRDGQPYTLVTWSVSEGDAAGTFNPHDPGVYTAPTLAGTFHVVATAQNDPSLTASAEVIVVPWDNTGGYQEGGYKLVAVWGADGGSNFQGRGRFRDPRGLAVDTMGNVYISDTVIGTIQKFSNNGMYLTELMTSAPANFLGPLTVNTNGRIFMLGGDTEYYQMYSITDGYLSSWNLLYRNDSYTSPPAKYGYRGFDVDAKDSYTYVTGTNVPYVIVASLDSAGGAYYKFPYTAKLAGIALDGTGNVYVAEKVNGTITKILPGGVTATTLINLKLSGVQAPSGIDVDITGCIYVADVEGNAVYKFNSQGYLLTKFGSSGTGPGQFSSPTFVKVDAMGNVFVLDKGNFRVQKFQPL